LQMGRRTDMTKLTLLRMLHDEECYNLGNMDHVIRPLAGVKVGTNLDAPDMTLRNVDGIMLISPAKRTFRHPAASTYCLC